MNHEYNCHDEKFQWALKALKSEEMSTSRGGKCTIIMAKENYCFTQNFCLYRKKKLNHSQFYYQFIENDFFFHSSRNLTKKSHFSFIV